MLLTTPFSLLNLTQTDPTLFFLPDQTIFKSPEIKGKGYGEKVEIVLGLLRQLYLSKVTILQKKFIFAASFVRYI